MVPVNEIPPVVSNDSVEPFTEPVAKDPLLVVPTGSGQVPEHDMTRHDQVPETELLDWLSVQLSEYEALPKLVKVRFHVPLQEPVTPPPVGGGLPAHPNV